ncbi:hypothetical protein CK503_10590 [Aliifodinibius salipaludis]|uniref:DUF4296 domain-containing protein n=1 Tax=Fodinibius salipaludis TaxID=2032627 RepID=A0A2A2G9A7_9BACT|nr:DUF4296 domain-containing protein [Aliifodinibius salipaludis]PAU93594.1 hypothetical protein CK503_10590 [Aliifodinibius salipaludis]
MKWLSLLIFLLLLSTSSCSENPSKPDQLIKEDKYIDLMVELQLVRSYGETNSLDSLTVDSLTDEIFQKYETTDSVFVQSHNYYQQFPEKQLSRIEKAIERLKMDQVSDTTKQDTTTN